MGTFAFPEDWVEIDEEHQFSYKVRFFDMEVKGGKSVAREKTEEEMKLDEDAGKGKGKGKGKKKKGEEEEQEFTQEELAAQKKSQLEKDEKEQIEKEEWDKLDKQTQFYRTFEHPNKHPHIRFYKSTQPEGEEEKANPETVQQTTEP